jgi:hypothetical protein
MSQQKYPLLYLSSPPPVDDDDASFAGATVRQPGQLVPLEDGHADGVQLLSAADDDDDDKQQQT